MNFRETILITADEFNLQKQFVEGAEEADTIAKVAYDIIRRRYLSGQADIIKLSTYQRSSISAGMFSFVQEGPRLIPYNEFRTRYNFISLVYLEDVCRPCFPKYIEWQTRMDTLDLNHDFTMLFIINGMSFDGFLGN